MHLLDACWFLAMMTGYTLRNAEYRLCLQRNLDLTDDEAEITEELPNISTSSDMENGSEDSNMRIISRVTSEHMELYCDATNPVLEEVVEIELPEGLGSVSPEVAKYIQQLQAKLSGATQELDVCKRALTALEMGNIVCKQNDLLDYLRSLEPDKVAELSQPASSEVGNVIQQVIDGLMATLCQEKSPPKTLPFGSGTSSITSSWEHDGAPAELLSNLPLQFQSSSTVTRDYLARLLFWCMLLGHHMRGLEYRLELSRTLSLSGDIALGMDEGRPELN